jgi:hypothetical protein
LQEVVLPNIRDSYYDSFWESLATNHHSLPVSTNHNPRPEKPTTLPTVILIARKGDTLFAAISEFDSTFLFVWDLL